MQYHLRLLFSYFVFLLGLSVLFLNPNLAYAADIRTGDHISLSQNETNLKNLYLFGSNIMLDAPVQNDLVVGGGDINLSGTVQNDLLLGGGNVTIKGKIGNNAKVAGGNITIDAPITNDLALAGGNLTLTKNASIGGDLLIAGSKIDIEGPVKGKVLVSGQEVTLNSSVAGDVNAGEVKTLTLGPQAKIGHNLTYTSEKQITVPSSVVGGKVTYHKSERHHEDKQAATAAAGSALFFKLVLDIILSLLLMYFFRQALVPLFERTRASPVQNGVYGFAFLILAPIAAVILLLLVWLGIASLLFIGLVTIISIYLMQLFVGWFVLTWWDRREKHAYVLDWKAAIFGPIVVTVLLFIPVLGWLVVAILYCVAIGSFVRSLASQLQHLQKTPKKN